jgi:hypothetical protein
MQIHDKCCEGSIEELATKLVDYGLRVAGETALFNNNPYAKNFVKGIQIAKTGK